MANVPSAPGVPALLTGFSSAGPVAALVADAVSFFLFGAGPQWGIFLNGQSVVTADTVAAFDFKKDYVVANYPVEQGGFETYDKVKMPALPRIRLTSGMNSANISSLLSSIDAIVQDLNLYSVVTPEAVYTSVNVVHYDYRRTAQNGNGMVTVDVWLQEVVVVVTATSQSASPSTTPTSNVPGSPGAAAAEQQYSQSNGLPSTWSGQQLAPAPGVSAAPSGVTSFPSGSDPFFGGSVSMTPWNPSHT